MAVQENEQSQVSQNTQGSETDHLDFKELGFLPYEE
jgi:hypothetical protein